MRQPEMLQAGSATSWRGMPAWSVAQPAASQATAPAAGQGAFSTAFRQVQQEVQQVIAHGWPGDDAPALNLEGQMRRAALGLGAPAEAAPTRAEQGASSAQQQEFLSQIGPWAEEAGRSLGVAPEIVAAHAALESGWGRRPLRDAQGRDSHNLFGLKAQPGWGGPRVDAATTEYEDGTAVGKTEAFRAYPDYASAFRDYARLLQDSPRYRDALQAGSDAGAFAQALARGGYATDPAYAAKLTRLAGRLQARD